MFDLNDTHGLDNHVNKDPHDQEWKEKELRKALGGDKADVRVIHGHVKLKTTAKPWELSPEDFQELKRRQEALMTFCNEHSIPALSHCVVRIRDGKHADGMSYSIPVGKEGTDQDRMPADILLRYAFFIMSIQTLDSETHEVCMQTISSVVHYILDDLVTRAVGKEMCDTMSDRDKLLIVLSGFDKGIEMFGHATPEGL